MDSTHTLVHLAINAPDARTLPLLLLLDEEANPRLCYSAAAFARYLQRQGVYSYEKIHKSVTVIGRLRDYYQLVACKDGRSPPSLPRFLEDFLFAYDHGSELGWRPSTNEQYLQARAAVFDYVKFVIDQSTTPWPANEVQFIETCRESWRHTGDAKKSLLFHTKPRNRKKARGRKRLVSGLHQYKPFPPNLIVPLIDLTKNIRDKLLFSILAFGGRRQSEVLQLFLQDVVTDNNSLNVFLRHPSQSPMSWTNRSQAVVRGTRKEYLKSMFGLLPRSDHGALVTFAGWKSVKFDDERRLSSETYFIRDVGGYLLSLHREYLYQFRSRHRNNNHPYYFVTADGAVLTVAALQKQFSLACRRVEKKFGVSLRGYGVHSLRHYYGFYSADVLGLAPLLIQKCMGHIQLSSTLVYIHISPEKAAAVLQEAERKAKLDGRIGISPEEREEIKQAFSTIDPIPHSWHRNANGYGDVDTKVLTRKT